MIPFIRSISELMAITESRDRPKHIAGEVVIDSMEEDSGQRKRYLRSLNKKKVELPELPKAKKQKWVGKTLFICKVFDELDYNNQIQSSYELTLQERQNKRNYKDAA